MGWTRHAGTVVSMAMLASVVANYAVHRHFERRHLEMLLAQAQSPEVADELSFHFPDAPRFADDSAAVPRELDEMGRPTVIEGVLPALQTIEDDSVPSAVDAEKPAPVPVPSEATPLQEDASGKSGSTGSDAVRNVIDEELAGSSREERDIWYEELKSLPAGVVRDLLQVRKQLRSLPRALHRPDVVERPPVNRTKVPFEPASQSRRLPSPDWSSTLTALENASARARHNMANVATPGFKRLRIVLVDAYGPSMWRQPDAETGGAGTSLAQPEGIRLAEPLLDTAQGKLVHTDRNLDLAIDGDGFFVAIANERTVFTRNGLMTLDPQRRICLATAEGSAVLQPVVTIPADAHEIQISALGQVSVLRKPGVDPEPVGQIHVARFACPARLRPIGGTLHTATAASGDAEIDKPGELGRGVIQQGCLEQSNAELEVESSELAQFELLIKSFPTATRPVTARGDDPASR